MRQRRSYSPRWKAAGAFAALIALQVPSMDPGLSRQTVRIVVPLPTAPADIYAPPSWGARCRMQWATLIVDNRPGAGSIIGTEIVAKAPPDGYMLLMRSNTHTVNESLAPKKPFILMKDFTAVAPVNYSDLLMVVHPSLPVKSVREFIQLAKAKPRGLNYASSGTGTPYHMAGELFKAMAASTSFTCRIKEAPKRGRVRQRPSRDDDRPSRDCADR